MRTQRACTPKRRSSGFTLVEMLVAVALVLLMMSLFAQVFQLAGGTITKQRGIAENDQRSRTFQNVITTDLNNRSFRTVMPWAVGEDTGLSEVDSARRQGYFYISENDPLNDVDDVLQFTISVNSDSRNQEANQIYGKATSDASVGWMASSGSGNYLTFANQPEADDSATTPNGSTHAPAAEVVYFVRAGKLYRRVLLMRDPLDLAGSNSQPIFTYNGTEFDAFDYTNPPPMASPIDTYPAGLSFWNDFDHSAFPVDGAAGAGTGPVARFHSVDDLKNDTSTNFPIGIPRWRYGNRTDLSGRPREFDDSGFFFGRFLHEETSDPDFHYPNGLSTGGINPLTAAITLNSSGVFSSFTGGARRGEDLLLSNVHSFDVKVWDPNALTGAGAFVDIGRTAANADVYSPAASDYSVTGPDNRSNFEYGPIDPSSAFPAPYDVNRVFDTWYPFVAGIQPPGSTNIKLDENGDDTNDPPPFRHVVYGAGATSGSYGIAVGQAPNPSIRQQSVWNANPSTPYAPGDLVFPTQDAAHQRDNGLRFVYRCVQVQGTPSTTRLQPDVTQWPASAGAQFQDPDPSISTTDFIVWEAVENWKPLRAIQITIRFFDITSEQMRQQTIVHTLAD